MHVCMCVREKVVSTAAKHVLEPQLLCKSNFCTGCPQLGQKKLSLMS